MSYQLYRYDLSPNELKFVDIIAAKDGSCMWKRFSKMVLRPDEFQYQYVGISKWVRCTFEPGFCKFNRFVKDLTEKEAFIELL